MELKGIHHIAFVVKDIDHFVDLFKEKLNMKLEKRFDSTSRSFAFFRVGKTTIELICPFRPDDDYYPFMKKSGLGAIHHVSFAVEDLDKTFNEIISLGLKTIQSKPIIAATGWKVLNLAPESDHGLGLQLTEE
jgi:methylmalonyl-CoA epimerase